MRLFLHMPKCAGTSVKKMLDETQVDILPDNQYFLLDSTTSGRSNIPEKSVIYGHFLPKNYITDVEQNNYTIVTILRDPIERLKSHYQFWNLDRGKEFNTRLWRKMHINRWTFEEFALSEGMRNSYMHYISGIPPEKIAYIGLYENLEQSIRRCFGALDIPYPAMAIPKENVAIDKVDIKLDADTYNSIKAFHADDYALYEYAKRKFHTEWSNVPQ